VTFGAGRLLVIENSEPALYAVTRKRSRRTNTGAWSRGAWRNIRDRERIRRLMSEFKPDIVFHAAALKHVPILEPTGRGRQNHIFRVGERCRCGVGGGRRGDVMISTDKAIEPDLDAGSDQAIRRDVCRRSDHDLAASPGKPRMRLISVRFGNVLASNGSVVPKFKAQNRGGWSGDGYPSRYGQVFHDELRGSLRPGDHAAAHALVPERPDVSVYVLNMGQAVKIVDLAERMIRLFRPAAWPRHRHRFHPGCGGRAAE